MAWGGGGGGGGGGAFHNSKPFFSFQKTSSRSKFRFCNFVDTCPLWNSQVVSSHGVPKI